MSKKFSSKEKTTQKMTKDGLVEQNAVTGESTRMTNRIADVDLKDGVKKDLSRPQSSVNPTKSQQSKRSQAFKQNGSNTVSDVKVNSGESSNDTKPQHRSETADAPVKHDSILPGNSVQQTTALNNNPLATIKPTSVADIAKPVGTLGVTHKLSSSKSKAMKAVKKAAPSLKTDKNRLKFSGDDAAPAKLKAKPSVADRKQIKAEKKLSVAERKLDRTVSKLEKAQDRLPTKRKLQKVRTVDNKTGKTKSKLKFDKPGIKDGGKLKTPKKINPVKTATNSAMVYGHKKMFQVENENVGTKAAHRAEMAVEAGVRTAFRIRKNAPFKKARKLERALKKKQINFAYRHSTVHNPRAHRNAFLRAFQKRKIRRNYAKAVRNSKKAARQAKRAGSAIVKIGKAIGRFIARNPKVALIIGIIILVIIIIMAAVSAASNLGGGTVKGIAYTTYLASDSDMLGAEAVYAGKENALQDMLDNYETLNPGYDEYVYDLDSIWHCPYVLMSILHAMHDLDWTLSQVQGTLSTLFDLQYTLTETETVEIRTKKETVKVMVTKIDPDTGEEYEKEEEEEIDVEYEYWIMTVTLENFDLSHLPVYIMNEERLGRYAMLMKTLGNRPDLFPVGLYPNASINLEYGKYDIPPEYFGDAKFAEIIAEAEKYLGFPYVWGGSNPSTSFDCSGFVSWVYNQCGWNFGRLGAKGLYGISTPVSPADAKPGDLIFFIGTYKAPDPNAPTHVGIYVGDGMMLHCGKPIGYASINTPYWQKHFYAFGRL